MGRNNVEDIYPLSPLQEGLLFEALYAPEGGSYFQQLKFRLRGPLDLDAWRAAWERVVERHPALRTSFVWERQERPLQVVRARVKVPWQDVDLRGLGPAEQRRRVEEFLEADHRRGFDLSKAPLLRLTMLRTGDYLFEFICSQHHLLLDGWSNSTLINEVLDFYKAFASGRESEPTRPRPFKDYIAWLKRQDLSEAEAFWRRTLAGFGAPTRLFERRTGGDPDASERGGADVREEQCRLSESATAALNAFGRAHGVTLYNLVLGAWAIVVGRYSGSDDVVCGITVAGRPAALSGVEAMVGMFINTLPLRVRLPRGARLLDWLRELQLRTLELREYEYSPLVRVQEWSDVPPGTPLFENMLVFENYPVSLEAGRVNLGAGVELEEVRSLEKADFPLAVIAAPGRELLVRIAYDARRFEPAAVVQLLGHFSSLLQALADASDRRLSELPLLTAAELRRVLYERNDTRSDYPRGKCLHELFEERVAREPSAIALTHEGRHVTYQELNRRANQLAHYLRRAGIGTESLVGLCVERSVEMVVGLLGVLKAGAAYVPLDPAHPRERLGLILDDCRPRLILAQQRFLEQMSTSQARVVCLDAEWESVAREGEDDPAGWACADNAAYVIYTSGSTGRPKGVVVTHAAIGSTVAWLRRRFSLSPGDRVLQNVPFTFDPSLGQIFGALTSGARLVLPRPGSHADTAYLIELIADQRVSLTDFPPSVLRVLTKEPGLERCLSLRHVLCGGEAMTGDIPEQFYARLGAELHNVYGPTEVAIDATHWPCPRDPVFGAIPIGRPVDNKQVFILDPEMRPVPDGVSGEIYLGGDGLARGYLNRPGMTAERFVPDPFSDAPGARLYRTGDLARYLPDGAVEFIGRADHQVKVRGYRVEPGEIEVALAAHEAVESCVVIARGDEAGDNVLVAYFVPAAGAAFEVRSLRAFLKERLPDQMIPAEFVELDEFPLTPSGKVDRRALPAHGAARAAGEDSGKARGVVQEVLKGAWEQVLGVTGVGARDNFFALGGHSLKAARLVSRLRAAFRIDLPLRAVFEKPTIAEQAETVETMLRDGEHLCLPPITPAPRDRNLPMSSAQRRLWFLDRLAPNNAFYNIAEAYRFGGPLQAAALEDTLNEIISRHESLRTTFAEEDGELVQVVAPARRLLLALFDPSLLPDGEGAEEARRLAAEEARQPFDLRQGPLVRATLLRLREDEHLLLLTLHHIVADGWSLGLLLEELSALYNARVAGEEPALPELPVQYADYAEWQRGCVQGELLEVELGYWRRKLGLAPAALDLPADRPRPPAQSFHGASHSFHIPAPVARSLGELSRREAATMFMTLLTAFKALLARYSGQEDIVVGSVTANRNRSEVERLIGFFVGTIVLRTDLSGDPTFREMLGRVRETTLGAYTHQDVPFERIVEELAPERDLSRAPLFQVMFSMQDTPGRAPSFRGLEFAPVWVEGGTSKFDLELLMGEAEDGIAGTIEYSTDLFNHETVERMALHLQTLLGAVTAAPDTRLSMLPLSTPDESARVLVEFNKTYADYPRERCFTQLFETQAGRTPDAVAVACAGERLTYEQLNRRANSAARLLAEQGVSSGTLVALLADRSVEFLTAILAIFKAGGAYLPLDPRAPTSRLSLVLGQSRARLVLFARRYERALDDALTQVGEAQPLRLAVERFLAGGRGEENLPPRADPCDLAYVIYTSGSTGIPKGAMIEHRGMLNHLYAKVADLQLSGRDVVAQTASQSFDISVWQFLAALLVGGCTEVFPDEIAFNPARLLETVAREGITVLETVPSLLRAALDTAPTDADGAPALMSLRWLVPTGEALPPELCCRWLERHPHVPLLNAYGPTECSDDVTHHPLHLPPAPDAVIVPIGTPVANTQVYILDRRMRPVPLGVAGELYVGGDGVGRGYLNDPARTAASFLPDPFSKRPGARLYRTGDRGRHLTGGQIEFLGRLDFQVKVRGHRIEPGEIEAALLRHPEVREAAVVAREDSPSDTRLVAYVVAPGGGATRAQAFRQFLKATLPEYAVPSAFVFLDALPLTPNGKLDRKALPRPEAARGGEGDGYMAPRNDIESRLVRIWEEVLGVKGVGIDDNFFEHGGHSLLALRLVGEIQRQFGRELPLAVLFQKGTVEHLAGVLREQFTATALSPLVAIQPRGTRPPLFFVHVGSGNVLCYLDLARSLGDDQPFYGIQDPNLYADEFPELPVEAMAARYVEAVREAQPHGPYLLGGWSFGGLVAFEMARQMRERGEEVALLALLDTGAPDWVRAQADPTDDASLLGILAREMGLRVADADLQPLTPEGMIAHVVVRMKEARLAFDDHAAYLRRQLEVFKSRIRVIHRYFPEVYAGRITFFRAAEEDAPGERTTELSGHGDDPTRGFSALTTEPIEVYTIPGTHHRIAREPHVRVLAESLRECAARATVGGLVLDAAGN
jgi:amino acid adenylation domain-containing protein